eukprot:1730040-Pleurochrysis_carterae.AAC.1
MTVVAESDAQHFSCDRCTRTVVCATVVEAALLSREHVRRMIQVHGILAHLSSKAQHPSWKAAPSRGVLVRQCHPRAIRRQSRVRAGAWRRSCGS